jgi:hypothetical protein
LTTEVPIFAYVARLLLEKAHPRRIPIVPDFTGPRILNVYWGCATCSIHLETPLNQRMVYASLAGALVLLHFCFFARCGEFLSGFLQLAEGGYAGAIHGQNRSDRKSAVRRDLVTMGFWGLCELSRGRARVEVCADRRGTAAPLLQGERGVSRNGRIKQCLEVSIAEAPEHELSMIDGLQQLMVISSIPNICGT